MTADVLLLAAGGLAREVLASIASAGSGVPGRSGDADAEAGARAASDVGARVVGFLDDDPGLHGTMLGGAPVLGPIDSARDRTESLLVCAGDGAARAAIVARLAAAGVGEERFARHIHPSVVVGAGSHVGPGSVILAGCVLTCDVSLGAHAVLMPRTVLTHDDVIGDCATFGAGATVAGRVRIGPRAYIGMNAAIRQDLRVGADAVVGMGSVVVRDVPARAVWAGSPAGPLGRSPEPAFAGPPAGSPAGPLTRTIGGV